MNSLESNLKDLRDVHSTGGGKPIGSRTAQGWVIGASRVWLDGLAGNLTSRGPADMRRTPSGMRPRLTPPGVALAGLSWFGLHANAAG